MHKDNSCHHILLTRETLAKGKPQWGWNLQDDSLYIRIWLRILTLLGVHEKCIVSQVPVRRLGLVRSLNHVRSWWIIYKCMQEEPTALTCNNTL